MLDNKYMKITNKRSRLLAMILAVMVVLALSITSQQKSKNVPIKTSYEISRLVEVCYINCDSVKEYGYYSVISDLENLHQKVEIVAEEKRIIELAKEKVAKEAERLRLGEAERKERARLARVELDKQREIRREEKRLANAKEKKMQNKIVSRSNNETFGQWIQFEATYYGSDCFKCSGLTAYGINVRNTIYHNGLRVVAVDPSVIKLGSIVEVKTPNETFKAIAGDTGGRINGYIIDVLVESEATSAKYGRHPVQVRILKSK